MNFLIRDTLGVWGADETLHTGLPGWVRPEAKMAVDPSGRAMIVYNDRPSAPDEFRSQVRDPTSGIWTEQVIDPSAFRVSNPLFVFAKPTGGFVAGWISTSGDPHVHFHDWDPATGLRSIATELDPILPPPGAVTSQGVAGAVNPIDGIYHFLATMRITVAGNVFRLWHQTYDPATGIATPLVQVTDEDFPYHTYDQRIVASQTDPGVMYATYTRNRENDGTDSNVHFIKFASGVWSAPEDISAADLSAGSQCELMIDQNDDLYTIRTEYDGATMALFFRRRLASNGTFEADIKVDTSVTNEPNGWDQLRGTDPWWPFFILPPMGKYIDKVTVIWGSETIIFQQELYISEAPLRDEDVEIFGLTTNHVVRMFDGVVGGSWHAWEGKDV